MEVYKRTVTEKRRAANRAAAAHSTGPRTEEGKRRSAFNSFKHGLYATQDSTIRQAFDRSGVDLAQYDQLHRELAASLQPQDPMQALLVEDLVRFYWLKNLSQRASAEWQARHSEGFRFACDQRRHEAQRKQAVISDQQAAGHGWLWVIECSQKFEKLYELLDSLDELARTAQWYGSYDDPEGSEEEPEDIDSGNPDEQLSPVGILFESIYHSKPTRTGKRMFELFEACAIDGASADDPRVAQLRELIRDERDSVKEQHRLYEINRERYITEPESMDNPALHALSDQWWTMVNREFAFDRQIASKLRLLMKLQSAASERQLDEDELPEASPPENDAGPDEDAPATPPTSSPDGEAAASGNPEQPAAAPEAQPPATTLAPEAANIESTETNPKQESARAGGPGSQAACFKSIETNPKRSLSRQRHESSGPHFVRSRNARRPPSQMSSRAAATSITGRRDGGLVTLLNLRW
jgi:hypothetical protein